MRSCINWNQFSIIDWSNSLDANTNIIQNESLWNIIAPHELCIAGNKGYDIISIAFKPCNFVYSLSSMPSGSLKSPGRQGTWSPWPESASVC